MGLRTFRVFMGLAAVSGAEEFDGICEEIDGRRNMLSLCKSRNSP